MKYIYFFALLFIFGCHSPSGNVINKSDSLNQVNKSDSLSHVNYKPTPPDNSQDNKTNPGDNKAANGQGNNSGGTSTYPTDKASVNDTSQESTHSGKKADHVIKNKTVIPQPKHL